MLPTEDAAWVGRELVRRFGLDAWQFALTATDANRWVLRMARQLTGRPKVLVFNYCYHGTVDESVIVLEDGRPRARPGNVGPAVDPVQTTSVVEFNDVDALRAALAPGDVAAVLAALPHVADVRQTGMILAIELCEGGRRATPFDPSRRIGLHAYRHALERGVLLRPLGDVLYWMPPYCIDDAQLELLAAVTGSAIEAATA